MPVQGVDGELISSPLLKLRSWAARRIKPVEVTYVGRGTFFVLTKTGLIYSNDRMIMNMGLMRDVRLFQFAERYASGPWGHSLGNLEHLESILKAFARLGAITRAEADRAMEVARKRANEVRVDHAMRDLNRALGDIKVLTNVKLPPTTLAKMRNSARQKAKR